MFSDVRMLFGKKFEEVVEFVQIRDEHNRGGFVEFKWAIEDIDNIIIAEKIDNDGELVNPRPFFIEFLLRFPMIYFPESETRKYLFFPAKRTENGVYQYDSNICKKFEVGKTIEAYYQISKTEENLILDAETKKPNHWIWHFIKGTSPVKEKNFMRYDIEIETSIDWAQEYLWYTVEDIGSDGLSVKEPIKYPIIEESEQIAKGDKERYRYKFYVCTEPHKTVTLKSDPVYLNLISKIDEGSIASEKNVPNIKGNADFSEIDHNIYCLNTKCMHIFAPDERTVTLKPTIDVIELKNLYNAKICVEDNKSVAKRKHDDEDIDDNEESQDEYRTLNLASDVKKFLKLDEIWKYSIHRLLFGDEITEIIDAEIKVKDTKEKTDNEKAKAHKDMGDAVSRLDNLQSIENKDNHKKAVEIFSYVEKQSDLDMQKVKFEENEIKEKAEKNGEKTEKLLFYYGQFIKLDYQKVLSEKLGNDNINAYVNIKDFCHHLHAVGDEDINKVILRDRDSFIEKPNATEDHRKIQDRYHQSVSNFSCPSCGHGLLPKQGQIETKVVMLIGDTSAGKSVYLANTLRAYLNNERFLNKMGITVTVSDEAEWYLDEIKSKIGESDQPTAEISKALYFRIKSGNSEKYLVIYDMPGEWFSSKKYYKERAGKMLRIYKASQIVLFLYPVDAISIPGGKKPTTSFDKFLNIIQDDIFNGTLPDEKGFGVRMEQYSKGLADKKLAFILSKIDKWREGELEVLFHQYKKNIKELLSLKGIETTLDIYVSDDEDVRKEYMLKVIQAEIEMTRSFFKNCLDTENALIESYLTLSNQNNDIAFFSYGSPEHKVASVDSINNAKRRYAAIRPFNSIQWILNEIFDYRQIAGD